MTLLELDEPLVRGVPREAVKRAIDALAPGYARLAKTDAVLDKPSIVVVDAQALDTLDQVCDLLPGHLFRCAQSVSRSVIRHDHDG